MFFKLIQKECCQTAKSMIYWIYIICIVLFFMTQMGKPGFDKVKEPQPGQEEGYGSVMSTNRDLIMRGTLWELAVDWYHDMWTTYPVGFSKHVTISEKEREEIQQILTDATGLSRQEIEKKLEEYYAQMQSEQGYVMLGKDIGFLDVQPSMTWEKFQKSMKKVCGILGAGSDFEEDVYSRGVAVPASYEDAKSEYDNFIEKDRFTGAYARLFSDYMGIVLGILPVFVAVTRSMRDRRAQMRDLIYVRSTSSFHIVLSRYIAMVCMMLLPVIAASVYTLVQCIGYTRGMDISVSYFAFAPYIFGWLFPEILVVSALGMCLTELTDTAAAVLIQAVWWYADIFLGASEGLSDGAYGMHLVMRHNSVLKYQIFKDHFSSLVVNRCLYTGMAAVFVALCVFIYSQKRKGRLDFYGKIRSNRKRKSKV